MTTTVITDNASGGDYTGTDDTRISSSTATSNYGSLTVTEVTSYAPGDNSRTLIRFSGLSNITGPVTVSSATLEIYLSNAPSGTYTIDVIKCLQPWTEAGVTWNTYDGTNNWNTAGCSGSGTDRAATASASLSTDTTLGYKSFSSSQLAADVQDWINNGSNNGWLLKRQTEAEDGTFKEFVTSENADDTKRPKLTVVYTVGGGAALMGQACL